MPHQDANGKIQSNKITDYYEKNVPIDRSSKERTPNNIERPSKRMTPSNYYSSCLREQGNDLLHNQDDKVDANGSLTTSPIEVEEESGPPTENFYSVDADCKVAECINEVRLIVVLEEI